MHMADVSDQWLYSAPNLTWQLQKQHTRTCWDCHLNNTYLPFLIKPRPFKLWRRRKIVVLFTSLVSVIKYLTRGIFRKKYTPSWQGRLVGNRGRPAGCTASIVRKQRAHRKWNRVIKPQVPPLITTSISKAPPPKHSTNNPNSATHWGPSVQTCEPIGAISH